MADSIKENPTKIAQEDNQPDIAAIIVKNMPEANRIMELPKEEQMKEFQRYGLDPQAVVDNYSDLATRSEANAKRNMASRNKIVTVGWIGLLGTAAAMFFVPLKHFANSKAIKWFMSGFAALTAGIVTTFAATEVFGRSVKEEGKQIAIETRDAFVREITVAIENTNLAKEAAVKEAAAAEAKAEVPENTMTSKIAPKAPVTSRGDYIEAANEAAKTKHEPRSLA
jgi:hypothetical protein